MPATGQSLCTEDRYQEFEAAAVEGNRTEAEGAYKVAVKSIDKAAAKGLMHKNNAAHKKSALTLKLNQIG